MAVKVAPFAGAWIEITMQLHLLRKQLASLPSRERGLKSPADQPTLSAPAVAPFAGAWIEMIICV